MNIPFVKNVGTNSEPIHIVDDYHNWATNFWGSMNVFSLEYWNNIINNNDIWLSYHNMIFNHADVEKIAENFNIVGFKKFAPQTSYSSYYSAEKRIHDNSTKTIMLYNIILSENLKNKLSDITCYKNINLFTHDFWNTGNFIIDFIHWYYLDYLKVDSQKFMDFYNEKVELQISSFVVSLYLLSCLSKNIEVVF